MSSQSLTGFLQVATPVVMPGILLLAACVTVTLSFTLPAQAFYEINSAGGDCPQIGDWDSETRTCTLTTDLDEDVRITSDAVKLDGNGHTISPENNPDYAVRIDEVAAVTVTNTIMDGYGVYAERADNARITNNEIKGAVIGINLFDLTDGRAEGNSIYGTEEETVIKGIVSQDTNNLRIIDNTIDRANEGIEFTRVDTATIEQNRVSNTISSFRFTALKNAQVSGNEVSNTNTAVFIEVDESEGTTFSQNIFRDAGIGIEFQVDDRGGPVLSVVPWWQSFFSVWRPLSAQAQVSAEHVFTQNNFTDITTRVLIENPANIAFSLEAAGTGNYWSSYDEVTEGCEDANADGICDAALVLSLVGLVDEYPEAQPLSISTPSAQCADGEDNDNDGLTDYPDDPGCLSADDTQELNTPPVPAPTCALSVTPAVIEVGATSTLFWTSEYADEASIDAGIGTVETEGGLVVGPNETTEYTAAFIGEGGTVSCSATLTVESGEPEPLELHEQAALNAIALANAVDPREGYLLGAKGWDYEQGAFVSVEEIVDGYQWRNVLFDETTLGTGLDCSGLVMWSYNYANDPTVPHYDNFITKQASYQQATDDQSVELPDDAQLRPGDLLFYDFSPASVHVVDHVAMFVGNEGVVNATDEDNGIQIIPASVMLGLGGRQPVRRPIDSETNIAVQVSSPVDLVVTDPDGNTIDSSVVEITNSEYIQAVDDWAYSEMVQGHDGLPADVVYSSRQRDGVYQITVVPDEDADPEETYSLSFRSGETTLVLAEDELVSNVPETGFTVGVSEGGAVVEEVEETLSAEEQFALIKADIKALDLRYRLLKRLLQVKVTKAEKFYNRDRTRSAVKELKQFKRLVRWLDRKDLITDTEADTMVETANKLIDTIKNE